MKRMVTAKEFMEMVVKVAVVEDAVVGVVVMAEGEKKKKIMQLLCPSSAFFNQE